MAPTYKYVRGAAVPKSVGNPTRVGTGLIEHQKPGAILPGHAGHTHDMSQDMSLDMYWGMSQDMSQF